MKRFPRTFQLSSVDADSRSITFLASSKDYVQSFEEDDEGNKREVYEAVVEWDLSRYLENPVFLNEHIRTEALGQAEHVEDTDEGLQVRVKFGPSAIQRIEEAWLLVREGILRAVSVGFDRDVLEEELRDGVPYRKTRGILHELSLVSVPADERALAKGKDEVLRLDAGGRLGKAQRTGSGGARIPARISKVGVFEYRNADGSISRELRTPEELFAPEAMASLQGVPVTRNHPYQYGGLVDPEIWRDVAVGHVENPRREGDYLVADLVVQDADVLDAIDAGELVENSAGYICKYDRTPGTWNGKPFTVRHTRIRFNHNALLPKGHGRAGRDVGLRLDANDAFCIGEVVMDEVVLDGKTYVKGSPEHITALEAKLTTLQVRLDEAEEELRKRSEEEEEQRKRSEEEEERKRKRAKRNSEEDEEERSEDDDEETRSEGDDDEEERKRKRAQRRKQRDKLLIRLVRLGMLEDDDEEKLDSLSERELMLQAIRQQDADFTGEGRSDDYIEGRFSTLQVVRNDSIDAIVSTVVGGKPAPKALPADEAALQRLHERNRNAWREAK